MRRRKVSKRVAEHSEEITSQSSADEDPSQGHEQFAAAETPEQLRLRLAKKLLADARQGLGEDAFFTEEPLGGDELLNGGGEVAPARRTLAAAPSERLLRGHRKPITAVAFTSKGDVFTAGKDCALLVFRSGDEYRRLVFSAGYPSDPGGHRDEVYCLETALDGELLASAGKDALIKLWRTTGKAVLLGELRGHQGPIHGLCFKGDGAELVSLSADRSLKLWSTEQRSLVQTLFGHRAEPQAVVPIGTDSVVSVGYDRAPILWRLERETQALFAAQSASLDCVAALGPQHFATGSEEGELCVWSLARRKPVFRLPAAHPGGWLSALAAHPALGLLAAGGRGGPLHIYRVHIDKAGVKLTRALEIPALGVVTALRFSIAGDTLAVVEAPEDRLGRWNFLRGARSRVRLLALFADA